MPTFFIQVSNGILTAEHRKGLGMAVWEFLWCLDRVTRVDSKELGYVLGGKPIQLHEIAEQLGSSQDTVSRNLHRLVETGYLQMKRTPYGHLIVVLKAKKRFGKSAASIPKRETAKVPSPDTADVRRDTANLQGDTADVPDVIKTSQDNNKDNSAARPKFTELGAELIKLFEGVDPKNKTYYANKTQRAAADFLIEEYGFNKVSKVVSLLPKTNSRNYFPNINSPNDLKEKWSKLEAALVREKTKNITSGRGLA